MYTGELQPAPQNYPKKISEREWEYKGQLYESLYQIERDKGYEAGNRSCILFDDYQNDEHDSVHKESDDKLIISIYGYDY